jgi:hypothetical protein
MQNEFEVRRILEQGFTEGWSVTHSKGIAPSELQDIERHFNLEKMEEIFHSRIVSAKNSNDEEELQFIHGMAYRYARVLSDYMHHRLKIQNSYRDNLQMQSRGRTRLLHESIYNAKLDKSMRKYCEIYPCK